MAKLNYFAVIDVGSNELQMKIAEYGLGAGGKLKVIEQLRGALALGEDTYETGVISDAYIRRTIEILRGFKLKLAEYGILSCRVVGTSAVREANNRDYVLNRVAQATGFHIEILDHPVESAWRLIAMLEELKVHPELARQNLQIVDIGAGSVHLSYFAQGKLIYSQSALLGALRMVGILEQLHLSAVKPLEAFELYLDVELKEIKDSQERAKQADALIIIGNETQYIKRMAKLKRTDTSLDPDEFEHVLDQLKVLKPLDLTLSYGIPPESCGQMLPAAAIIKKYLNFSAAKTLYIPNADLCRGLLFSHLAEHHRYKLIKNIDEIVLSQADELALRFEVDIEHSRRIEKNALLIFRTIMKEFGLTNRQRLYLQLAARLMHVGGFIRHPRHGNMSYSIIKDLELLGITQKERQRVARITEFANDLNSPKRSDMLELPGELRQEIICLVAILRIAESLDSSKQGHLELIRSRVKNDFLQLYYKEIAETPLEQFFLPQKSQLFQDVFGLQVQLIKEK